MSEVTAQVNEAFTLTCKKCGSTSVTVNFNDGRDYDGEASLHICCNECPNPVDITDVEDYKRL